MGMTVPVQSGECVVKLDTSAAANSGASLGKPYHFTIYYTGGVRDTGPPSEPIFSDDVFAWGVNMAGIGNPADPLAQYAAWHMESKFYQGYSQQSPYTEVFLETIDTNGTTRRPISWVGTHDGAFSNAGMAASLITFQDASHTPKLNFDFRAANSCRVEDGFSFVFADNNVPVARQTNAAGTAAYALPYLDDADNIAVSRPITTPVSNGVASGPTLCSRGPNTGAAKIAAPDAAAASVEISCGKNGAKKSAIVGVDAGNNLVIGQTGSNGAIYQDFNASVIWRNRFNYAKTMELTKDLLTVNAAVKHKGFSMAALPNPATLGKWTEIVITDHPSGIVKAMSDGVQWRHVATAGAPL